MTATGVSYNVNADTAAAALAIALGAEKLVVLTDVEGLYADWPNRDSIIRTIGAERLRALLPDLESGMVPKMEACLRAVDGGVPRAHVIDGRIPHCVLLEVFTDSGVGTMVLPEEVHVVTGWQERWQGALMDNYGTPPLMLVRGRGARVWDADGNEYIDLLAGIAVNALGHGDPRLVRGGHRASCPPSGTRATSPRPSRRSRSPSGWSPCSGTPHARVFFCNSGAEANEAAFKLARLTGRTHMVVAQSSFHGRTMGALALTAQPAKQDPFRPLPGDVTAVPYGDVEALRAAVGPQTAAIVLEPIQGEGGVIVPPPGYLAAARRIADEHGCAARARRGADRHRPHGDLVRPPARGRAPRRHDAGQGARRRAADRCVRGDRAGRRAVRPGLPRLDVRRQPGVVRRRPRRARRDRRRRPPRRARREAHDLLAAGLVERSHGVVDHVRGRGLLHGGRAGRRRPRRTSSARPGRRASSSTPCRPTPSGWPRP